MRIVVANSKGGVGKSTFVLAIADCLGAEIVDLDHQGTISKAAKFSGRHMPVLLENAKAENIVFDTPPYRVDSLKSILKEADLIIVPTKVGIADLLACKGIIDDIRAIGAEKKAWIVFNEVRKPHNKSYIEDKKLFFKNYGDIQKAQTEISNLVGFSALLKKPIEGKAKEEFEKLLKELRLL